MRTTSRTHDRVQRVVDVCVAATALLLLSPVMLVVAVLVGAALGRPVLFRQTRPGWHGRPFTMVKFRTMLDVDPERGLISDADRMTRLGRLLRATSLDELPALWNVLVGDMSLVGPRPLLVRYLDRYTPEQARRHLVRPGITGLAQVRGRNALSWEEKFALDVWYVDNRSLPLNARICAETVLTVLRRDGIAAEGEVTMPEFIGTASAGGESPTVDRMADV
jgi:lipopolysaccharide/colanic/teichoic acid biosynthesis glycosyltransferase